MMSVRVLVSVLAVIATVQGRPQGTSGDPLGLTEALGQATGIGATLFSGAVTTTQALGEQIRDVASGAWTAATQAVLGMNNAFRETAVGALEGVREAAGETGEFIGDSIRSGGRFAADAVTNGFDTARDATDAAGQFVAGMSRSAIQGGIATAESAGDLAQDTVENVGSLANSANAVVRQAVVSGVENFSDPGRF